MKILFILLLFPLAIVGQDIKIDESDGFTGQRYIETTIVSLKSAYTNGLGLSLSASADHFLVNIVGYGDINEPVKKTDLVYLLLENGLVITAVSIGDQAANQGGLTKVYQHHYLIKFKDLQQLITHTTVLVRIGTANGSRDITVSKRAAKEIKRSASILAKAFARSSSKNK